MINAGTSTISTSAGGVTSQSGFSGAGASLAAFTFTAQAMADNYVLPANSTAPLTFNVLANDIGVSNAVPTSGMPGCGHVSMGACVACRPLPHRLLVAREVLARSVDIGGAGLAEGDAVYLEAGGFQDGFEHAEQVGHEYLRSF